MTTTENGLYLFEDGDAPDLRKLNSSMELLDPLLAGGGGQGMVPLLSWTCDFPINKGVVGELGTGSVIDFQGNAGDNLDLVLSEVDGTSLPDRSDFGLVHKNKLRIRFKNGLDSVKALGYTGFMYLSTAVINNADDGALVGLCPGDGSALLSVATLHTVGIRIPIICRAQLFFVTNGDSTDWAVYSSDHNINVHCFLRMFGSKNYEVKNAGWNFFSVRD